MNNTTYDIHNTIIHNTRYKIQNSPHNAQYTLQDTQNNTQYTRHDTQAKNNPQSIEQHTKRVTQNIIHDRWCKLQLRIQNAEHEIQPEDGLGNM